MLFNVIGFDTEYIYKSIYLLTVVWRTRQTSGRKRGGTRYELLRDIYLSAWSLCEIRNERNLPVINIHSIVFAWDIGNNEDDYMGNCNIPSECLRATLVWHLTCAVGYNSSWFWKENIYMSQMSFVFFLYSTSVSSLMETWYGGRTNLRIILSDMN